MNLKDLLDGAKPTLDDYSSFLLLCEELSSDELWEIVTEYPCIDVILKNAVLELLRQKITQENKVNFDENHRKYLMEILKNKKN